MDIGTKFGLVVMALGLAIDLVGLLFPDEVIRMTRRTRIKLLVAGSLIMVGGLAVIIFWPAPNVGARSSSDSSHPPQVTQMGTARGSGGAGVINGNQYNTFNPPPPSLPKQKVRSPSRASANGSPAMCAPGANCSHGQSGGVSIGTVNSGGQP
jgi:hypothetical protein